MTGVVLIVAIFFSLLIWVALIIAWIRCGCRFEDTGRRWPW